MIKGMAIRRDFMTQRKKFRRRKREERDQNMKNMQKG